MGTIPDGLYEAFGDTLRILASTRRSAALLEKLELALRNAQARGLDRESTAIIIERQAPQFAQLAVVVRDRRGMSARDWVAVILAVLTLLAATGDAISNYMTDQELTHIIQQLARALPAASKVPSAPGASAPKPASGNEGGGKATRIP